MHQVPRLMALPQGAARALRRMPRVRQSSTLTTASSPLPSQHQHKPQQPRWQRCLATTAHKSSPTTTTNNNNANTNTNKPRAPRHFNLLAGHSAATSTTMTEASSSSSSSSAPAKSSAATTSAVVYRHRPQRYSPASFQGTDRKYWARRDRAKFRTLLEDCVATGSASAVLREYLDEYPILHNRWSDQELVLIVGALMQCQRNQQALAVLKNQIKGVTTDRDRLNRVAAESARLGNSFIAMGILEIAAHFGLQPDVITFTSAIHACARGAHDEISQVFYLLDEMIAADVKPNHRTYGALVLAYARLNRWEDIEALLATIPYDDEPEGPANGQGQGHENDHENDHDHDRAKAKAMASSSASPLRPRLLKSEVYASAIITCSRNRQFVYATQLFASLMAQGLYLGENVSNAALSACSRTSDTEMLAQILSFVEAHATPSIYTFNTMISAFGNAQRMDDAMAVYHRLLATGNRPDQDQSHGQGHGEGHGRGVTPDLVTFNALLLAARRSRRGDLVPEILEQMAGYNLHWDVYTLNSLLELCQIEKDVTRARQYWEQAKHEQGLRIDRANYETLLGVYYDAGEYALVLSLWRRNKNCRRRAKSAKSLNFLLRSCAQLGDATAGAEFLKEFAQRGQIATAIAHNHLLMAHLTPPQRHQDQEDEERNQDFNVETKTTAKTEATATEALAETETDWHAALAQLKHMASVPKLSTTFAFTAMLKHAVAHGRYEDALTVYDMYLDTVHEFQAAWCPQLRFPSDAVYVYALRAAHALRDHERVLAIFQAVPSAITSLAVKTALVREVLQSCAHHEDWRRAVSLYGELAPLVDDATNVELYDVVVKIVARAGEFERALDVDGGEWYRQNRPDQGWF